MRKQNPKLYYEIPLRERAWEQRWKIAVYLGIAAMFATCYFLQAQTTLMWR